MVIGYKTSKFYNIDKLPNDCHPLGFDAENPWYKRPKASVSYTPEAVTIAVIGNLFLQLAPNPPRKSHG